MFNLFELVFFSYLKLLRSTFFVHFYDRVINSNKMRTTTHKASFETICKENVLTIYKYLVRAKDLSFFSHFG